MNFVKNIELFWDEWNKAHIKKHKVSVGEVEEVFKAKKVVRESYKGRLIIVGRSKKSRLLTIILSFERQKDAYVVSARDSSKKERKIYNDQSKTNE